MISVAKKKYYDTSKFTYLKGYNEDKEDEDKVEQARSQYMNTKREEIPSPTTPKRDGKYLEPVKIEKKKIEVEPDRPKFSFNPSRSVLGDVKKESRTKPQQTKTERKSPFAYKDIKPVPSEGMKKVGNYAKAYADLLTWDGDMNTWQEKRDKLPFRPFVENFDRAFDPIADLVAPKTAEYKAKREEKYNALKESNPVQSTVGNIAGEFAKYGAGYAALGPLASKAPGLAAIKNPIVKTLATEGAKDLAVGTAMRSIEGVADKQSIGEIGKNIVKDMPRDLAFNALLLGGGKAFKGISKAVGDAKINKSLKTASKIADDIKPSYSDNIGMNLRPKSEQAKPQFVGSDNIGVNLRPKFEPPIKPIVEQVKPQFVGSDNIGVNLRPKFEQVKPRFVGSDNIGMNLRPKFESKDETIEPIFDVSDEIYYRGEMQASQMGEEKNILRQKDVVSDIMGKTPQKLYDNQAEEVARLEEVLKKNNFFSRWSKERAMGELRRAQELLEKRLKKVNEIKIREEASKLPITYVTSQLENAENYANQSINMAKKLGKDSVLFGDLSKMQKPIIRKFQLDKNRKTVDLTKYGENGFLSTNDVEQILKNEFGMKDEEVEHFIDVLIPNSHYYDWEDDIFQSFGLFRDEMLLKVYNAIKDKVDVVRYTEGVQDNYAVLNRKIIKEIKEAAEDAIKDEGSLKPMIENKTAPSGQIEKGFNEFDIHSPDDSSYRLVKRSEQKGLVEPYKEDLSWLKFKIKDKPTDLNNVTDVLKEKPSINIPKVETPVKSNLKGYMTEDADFNKVIDKIMSRDLAFFSNSPSKNEISRALDMYKSTRDGYISEMMTTLKKQMGKGTETSLIPTPDGMKRVTVSENPKWYRDFYKANGRKPSNEELKELAEQFLKNGYDDLNGQIPKNDFFNELDDTVKAYEHLKNVDASTAKITTENEDRVLKMLRGEIPESESELVKAYVGLKRNKAQGMNIDLQLFTELEKKLDTLGRIKLGEEMKPQTNWFKEAYQKFVDDTHSLKDIDNVAKKLGQESNVQMLAMNEKNSGKIISAMIENGVSDLNGNTVTRPIKEIFNQIDVKDKAAFTDYLLHKHNIDRMKQNKPVFGEVDGVLIDGPRSMQKVREYESMYPHFKQVSQEWNSAYDSFMRNWLVDGGLLSEAQYNAMKEMYPNYVPTYRDMSDKVKGQPKIFRPKGYVNQKAGIKGAIGSDRTVIDPIESQLQLMDKYIKATKRNQVGQELLRLVEEVPEMKAFADIIGRPKEIVNDLDEVENVVYNITKNIEWKKNEPNVVTVMRDGEPIYIAIKDKRVLDALLATSDKQGTLDTIGRTVNKYATQPFKNLTTSNNPLFGGVNFMRDTQTRYIQGDNLNPAKEMAQTIKAAQEMISKDELFKKYKAVGGGANFLANDERAFKRLAKDVYQHGKSIKNLAKYPIEMVNKFNESVEILNRYPAFKSTYLDEIAKGTDERMALEKAINASNEITTNFNRGGSITKAIDSIFPYTNAATQGIDKAARTFKDKPLQTSFKVALATAIPSIGAYLMQKDDPDYQQLNNRTKDAYIPIGTNPDDEFGNNKYFKFPMAQTYNTIGSLANRTARAIGGEDNAFKGFGQTVLGNLSPVDLSAGGIFSPIQDIQKNKDFAGRTIVPMSMQERSPYLQYDDKTSEIGKTVSKGLRGIGVENQYTSPKAIDHMIDSWTGVIGDFALPLTTNDGKTAGEKAIGPVTRRFVADPIYSNQGVQDFYDSYNELKRGNADSSFMSNSADKGLPTVSKAKETEAFNISKAMSEISSEINQVQKSNLPAEQKETKIRALNIQKAMMAMEFNKANNVKDIDYSVPYEVNPYQAYIDKLSTLGIDNVKPKVYNNSTYKVNDKEVSLTAEDKVKYTKMAGEMYIEKTAKIFKSNLSDEQKAKKIAEINKQIDKKIKEMMRRN